MRIKGSVRPERQTVSESISKPGYVDLRFTANVDEIVDGDAVYFEYDEYIILQKQFEGLMEELEAEYDQWFDAARNEEIERLARPIYLERDTRLSQCDYTQLADYHASQEERNLWLAYRQSLRDLQTQPGFPYDVIWPDNPARAEENITVAQELQGLARLLASTFQTQILFDRASDGGMITDEMILQSAAVIEYPEWAPEHEYQKGVILRASDNPSMLFEVVNKHISNAVYPLKTTPAYYRLIELVHTGAQDDPIPYPEEPGVLVNVVAGLYYAYKGDLYLALNNVPNCIWYPGEPGVHHWQLVTGEDEAE